MSRVYFIRPKGMKGPIKIGCSASPERRRGSLDTWSPFPLEIIAQIDGGELLERRFHTFFAASHQRREWFNWCPLFDEVVAAINDGSFDIETLPSGEHICRRGYERTPSQRSQLSISLRCTHTQSRSGYECPVRYHGVIDRGDPAELDIVGKYLAEPHVYGTLPNSKWRLSRARKYHEKLGIPFEQAA